MSNLTNISPKVINAYHQEMVGKMSPATTKRKISSLKTFFDWASREGHVSTNPFIKTQEPEPQPKPQLGRSSKIGLKILAVTSFTLGMAVFAIVLSQRLQLPIPFQLTPAKEPTAKLVLKSPEPIATSSAGLSSLEALPSTGSALPIALNWASVDEGNLMIGGVDISKITLSTDTASDGNITINPDGAGIANFIFEGNNGDFLTAQAPNLTSGSLFYGLVANNATNYDLIRLQSGSSPTTRFSVDALGNTYVGGSQIINDGLLTQGNLSVDQDINLLRGNLKIGGVTRFNSLGRLASITGYYQDSGLFEIDQGAPDWASIEKTLTTAAGVATNDVLTLTLDESALTTGSTRDTLVLNRSGGSGNAYALFVDNGDVRFDGNIEYTGSLTSLSDIRLKENLEPIKNPLNILNQISGKFYNLVTSKQREAGVIAQEVAQVLPEAVRVIDREKGYLGVSYQSLIPVMIEGIKELNSRTEKIINQARIVSPVVETKLLSPIPDSDLTVKLAQNSKFKVQNEKDEEVASIDSVGNATFSGTLTADEVIANNVKATNLDEIEAVLKKAEADIAQLALGTNNQPLTVTSDLSIAHSLAIGADLVIQNNSFDTLKEPLRLQSLAMAPIEMMAGTFRIETNGDVTIIGNIHIAGNLEAEEAKFDKTTTNKLVIASTSEESTQPLSGVSAGVIETNATVGTAKIASGSAEITIKNPRVTDYTLVYVTPTTSTKNQVLFIKSKRAGQFTVGFEEAISGEVEFNWWIIDVLTPDI